jgi:hypothetical protein
MDNALYRSFIAQYPSCARLIANLDRIENAISPKCFDSFFEPVAFLRSSEPKSATSLVGRLAPYLDAWRCHISYGTTARLRGLTLPLLQQLFDRRLSIASILQRAVMEHAGRAAFALCRLTDCSKTSEWDELRDLIPKTLFGTCMTALDGTVFEDLAEPLAQRPLKPGDYINALERFAGTQENGGKSFFNGIYALLCELTHPSQRANQPFCQVLETRSDGWRLEYAWEEECKTDAIEGALRSTMRCLQAGYAASAMLLTWTFEESGDGVLATEPGDSELKWIWQNLLDPGLVWE